MAYIYKITNKLNGKIYVGQTVSKLEARFKRHVVDSKRMGCALHIAIQRHGAHNFDIVELEQCPREHLNEREVFWISSLDSRRKSVGYNMTSGGNGGDMSQQPKYQAAMSNRDYRGSKNPNYGKLGELSGNFGRVASAEERQKMSDKRHEYWRSLDEETKALRSNKIAGSKNGMYGRKPSPVVPICIDGVTYKSKAEALRVLKITPTHLKRLLENGSA